MCCWIGRIWICRHEAKEEFLEKGFIKSKEIEVRKLFQDSSMAGMILGQLGLAHQRL